MRERLRERSSWDPPVITYRTADIVVVKRILNGQRIARSLYVYFLVSSLGVIHLHHVVAVDCCSRSSSGRSDERSKKRKVVPWFYWRVNPCF